MALVFDWDDSNRKHIARHRVTTTEAEQVVLNNPLDLEMQSEDGEERYVQLGKTNRQRILVVLGEKRNSE